VCRDCVFDGKCGKPCVDCGQNKDGRLRCDGAACVVCATDAHCAAGLHCKDKASCVQCLTREHCTTALGPGWACGANNQCQRCVSDGQCGPSCSACTGAFHCRDHVSACVECVTDAHCTGPRGPGWYCGGNVCQRCNIPARCGPTCMACGAGAYCKDNVSSPACLPCLSNTHCPAGQACFTLAGLPNRCVPQASVHSLIWQGGQGWYRTAPAAGDGSPDWPHANTWVGPIPLTSLPGAGDIQAWSSTVYQDGRTLLQGYWRGNQGYYRTVPILLNDTVEWTAASAWGPAPFALPPGSAGDVQGVDMPAYPNGSRLIQGVWRGGHSYYREVSFRLDGTPDWGLQPWMPAASLPNPMGGPLQTQTSFPFPTIDKLTGTWQVSVWQDGQSWYLTAPIKGGEPKFAEATGWIYIGTVALPGSGTLQAHDTFVLR
jgi:hypothetical protein